jgi:undecaprenyl-diphosphatase
MLAYVFFRNHGLRGLWFLFAFGLLVTFCDQISTNVFKYGFERLRPSHNPVIREMVHLVNNNRGGLYGFVSSHATNSFGLAMLVSLIFRNKWLGFFIFSWAFLNAYSRIYLGLHYPGDIVGGMLLGLLIGKIIYELFLRIAPRTLIISHHNKRTLKKGLAKSFTQSSISLICVTILLSYALLLLSSDILLKLM